MAAANAGDAEAKMFSKSAEYEQFMGRWSRLLAAKHIAFAQVEDGDRVLDVGAGTGAFAHVLAASRPNCDITGIDPAKDMIAYAKANAKSDRTHFEVGDAQALPYGNAKFDRTIAQLVMNFIPDHEKALEEMIRVTKPGGSVSACVWDYSAGMQSLRFFWDEVVALDPAAAAKDEKSMKLSHKGELAALWNKAGLTEVDEQPLEIDLHFASFDDYWGPFLKGAGPGGAYVTSRTSEDRKKIEDRLRKRVLGDKADGPFTLKGRAWCVRGTVPAVTR